MHKSLIWPAPWPGNLWLLLPPTFQALIDGLYVQEAVDGSYNELVQLLLGKGGKLFRNGQVQCGTVITTSCSSLAEEAVCWSSH